MEKEHGVGVSRDRGLKPAKCASIRSMCCCASSAWLHALLAQLDAAEPRSSLFRRQAGWFIALALRGNPNLALRRPVTVMLLAPFSFQRFCQCTIYRSSTSVMENHLREFLSNNTLILILMTPRGNTLFLEVMPIFSHTQRLVCEKIWQATDDPNIKFLSKRDMWWIGAAWRHCKVEMRTKKIET